MGYPTRIATCCYCSSRAALVLGKDRHELNCANCGAPLHDMKRFRRDTVPKFETCSEKPKRRKSTRKNRSKGGSGSCRKLKKGSKSIMHSFLEEAFDVIEDIFD